MSSAASLSAGAGPAGLVLALTLVKNGVKVRIVDKLAQPYPDQRGAAIQPRTLEVYNFLGILPDILEAGIPPKPLRFYKLPGGIEPISTFHMTPIEEPTPSTPYINCWMLGQGKAQEILRKHLEQYGCHVEFGTELRSFEQRADGVVAHLVKLSGERERSETVTCHWLIGTDGARGVVRKKLGLSFLGETIPVRTLIGEMEVKGVDSEYWHTWGDFKTKGVLLRPTEEPGLFQFGVKADDHDKLLSDHDATVKYCKEVTDRNDIVFGKIYRMIDYSPKVRMVDRFSEDAAHVHSPAGGQGMNSSVQDALNLGWKLALVEKGMATPSFLSTYDEERLPVIAHMLGETTKAFRKLYQTLDDPEIGWKREKEMRQLGIHYRWSSIVIDERDPEGVPRQPEDIYGTQAGSVRAGDRAPDAPGLVPVRGDKSTAEPTSLFDLFGPTHHTVLIFSTSDELIAAARDVLKGYSLGLIRSALIYPQGHRDLSVSDDSRANMIVVTDRDGHAHEGYRVLQEGIKIVVVRPDGVVGGMLFGSPTLKKYLGKVFSATTE